MATNAAIDTSVKVSGIGTETLGRAGLSAFEATSLAIVASDFIAIMAVSASAVALRHALSSRYPLAACVEIIPFLGMLLPAFALQDLYPGLLIHPAEEMKKVFSSFTIVLLLWASATFLTKTGSIYSRSVFLSIWVLGTPVIIALRYITRELLAKQKWWGISTVVLGSGPAARRVVKLIAHGRRGLKVIGVLADGGDSATWPEELPPLLGPLSLGPSLAKQRFAQYAIVAMPQKSNTELRRDIQEYCKGFTRVLLIPDMTGLCSLGIRTREVGGEIGFEFRQRLFSVAASLTKRILDIVISSTILAISLPLFVVIFSLIKATSRGPAFFAHSRYGLDGETFRAWKFRTMVPDAERVLLDFLNKHPEYLSEWERDQKLKMDPRITRIGKYLRQLSLDELPQLFNVLMGHMSLVGPRPIVQAEIEKYGRNFGLYSRVRPGITGLWQVSGRNNTTYDERVSLDEYYVHNWSFWLDIYILIRTVRVLVTREGAY